jgi:hypothetical protein
MYAKGPALGNSYGKFIRMTAAPLQRCTMVSSTIVLVDYKGKCDVSSISLNQQAIAYIE